LSSQLSFAHFTTFFSSPHPPRRSTLFPYTTLFRSWSTQTAKIAGNSAARSTIVRANLAGQAMAHCCSPCRSGVACVCIEFQPPRSEEHTSELQSRGHLVCRLLLEKKKIPPCGQSGE